MAETIDTILERMLLQIPYRGNNRYLVVGVTENG